MHFHSTGDPLLPWNAMEEGLQHMYTLDILNWTCPALGSLSEDTSFTGGLQNLPTAAPLELQHLLASLLVKGMAMRE